MTLPNSFRANVFFAAISFPKCVLRVSLIGMCFERISHEKLIEFLGIDPQKGRKLKGLTSSALLRRGNTLGLVENGKTIVCDFKDPSCINNAVSRSQIAVNSYRSRMQIFHSLKEIKIGMEQFS